MYQFLFSDQCNQLKSAWASVVTRSKQQKQKLEESLSLHQVLPNADKVLKALKTLKSSLQIDAIPTNTSKLDELLKFFNSARSQLESIEDEAESVVKAGQKLLRTGKNALSKLIENLLIFNLLKDIHHPRK